MNTQIFRRVAAIILAAVLSFTAASAGVFAEDGYVEIVVRFVTPPSAALRIMHGYAADNVLEGEDFDAWAREAHSNFAAQLEEIIPVFLEQAQVETLGDNHRLFNGVTLRVPAFLAHRIAALPEVAEVFPNVTFHASAGIADFNGQPFDGQPFDAHLFNREARQLFDTARIHGELGYTGAGVTVAVLDTGIYYHHPRFENFLDETGRIPGRDFVDNDDDPMEALPGQPGQFGQPGLGTTHGTHVSGTVVAMAPDINLRHYRVLASDGGRWEWLIDGIEAAHASSDIMNLSIGTVQNVIFAPALEAVNLAALDGTVVVTAAGNSGENGSFSISTPGLASLPITVGAALPGSNPGGRDTPDRVSSFSARGPVPHTFHIKPDILAPGGETLHFSIVSAAPCEIKARLMNSARPLAEDSGVFTAGAGFVQPREALTGSAFATVTHPVDIGAGNLVFTSETERLTMPFAAVLISLGEPETSPGTGTAEDPFLISAPSHLLWLAEARTADTYFRLTADIVSPPNLMAVEFSGTFDGNGHAITVDIDSEYSFINAAALFAEITENGKVRNLTVRGTVRGDFGVGGIAGINYGTVQNSRFEGNITGRGSVGGIVGSNRGGLIENCATYGTITITGETASPFNAGGIAGYNDGRVFGNAAHIDINGVFGVGGE